MKYRIRSGEPEVKELWNNLSSKFEKDLLKGDEKKKFKKLGKALTYLSSNPKHNSLSTHEIKPLSIKFGKKVWQSYLENKTPAAGRIFWVYGPGKEDITVIGIEPHPEDSKRGGYETVKLSDLPE
ncbi:MAG: hypothetical protein ACYDEE_00610 [Ignavibacteriaceae bacterium]